MFRFLGFPTKGAKVLHALEYKKSHLGKTAKLVVELPDGKVESYFLKILLMGEIGRKMCEGEYESLKAIYEVSAGFVPKSYYWGEYDKNTQPYFLLEEFRDIGKQPADPITLATKLADLHKHSKSPMGKFGFHVKTCHDGATGEAFVFDACSFYGHNEYDTGNWRASRHLLSDEKYMECYKENFPGSEPVEDWDARNLLYSLPFNLGNAMYIPESDQRQVVYEDMMTL
ncbi:hypothetical protein HYALB_00001601, partial [Hymenoscyphus albidus]